MAASEGDGTDAACEGDGTDAACEGMACADNSEE